MPLASIFSSSPLASSLPLLSGKTWSVPDSCYWRHLRETWSVPYYDCFGWQKTRYQYDAFGELLAGDTDINEYTFGGQRLDPESGLYHFHFRQYDPVAGVWTTPDPISVFGGVNLYQYVGNNPVNYRDWLGLSEISDVNGGYADNGGKGYNGGVDNDTGGELGDDGDSDGGWFDDWFGEDDEEEDVGYGMASVAVAANPTSVAQAAKAFWDVLKTTVIVTITRPLQYVVAAFALVALTPSSIAMDEEIPDEEVADRPPAGSKPINVTPWSGDHGKIKEQIGAKPDDDVKISPDGEAWSENPDGTWTNNGPVDAYTGSGRPSGRRGKDRKNCR